jgi:hypothetical protein
MIPRLVVASLLLALTLGAEERPQPYEAEPTLWTCPRGWLITHRGTCLAEHEGPVVEYGCEVHENHRGDVTHQICPSQPIEWVGNVGDFGAPLVTAAPVGGVGIIIGIGR